MSGMRISQLILHVTHIKAYKVKVFSMDEVNNTLNQFVKVQKIHIGNNLMLNK
jgi:hypothetical protein